MQQQFQGTGLQQSDQAPLKLGRGTSATAKVYSQGFRKKARPPGSAINRPSKGQSK
jgi:hypothetical protein